jgi:opacity protein-like surface antigen
MKKFVKLLLASSAIASMFTGAATAADLLVKAPRPVVPVWSWTGCYLGGHGGGLWVRKEYTEIPGPGVGGLPVAAGDHRANSWLAGVQVGCDVQFVGTPVVVGIQGDYAWTNANASHLYPGTVADYLDSTTKSLSTATARLGYAWDRLLLYVKGGGAWENDKYSLRTPAFPFLWTGEEIRFGYTVGIGAEYAFTNGLSAFLEYNYYDFGRNTATFDFNPVLRGPGTRYFDIKETKSVVRAGLNWRFWSYEPAVVAKY